MKNKYNKLTCLFGHHDYSDKLTRDKYRRSIYLCKVCKRSGHVKWNNGVEIWYDYDNEGNLIHEKWNNGYEIWRDYDKEGNVTHQKWHDGSEVWYGEKQIQ